MSDEKKNRRTPVEIAQAHADRAAQAVEKARAKFEKAEEKVEKAEQEAEKAGANLDAAIREADYRQAHPLLQDAESERQDVLGGTDSVF